LGTLNKVPNMRKCKMCGEIKELSYFANAGKINGVNYKRYLCIPCYSISKKPRKEKLKNDFIEWKKTLKCNRCGFADYRALQFHHFDEKMHNISQMVSEGFNLNKIQGEAKKCEVLCANCHQIHHYEERSIA